MQQHTNIYRYVDIGTQSEVHTLNAALHLDKARITISLRFLTCRVAGIEYSQNAIFILTISMKVYQTM